MGIIESANLEYKMNVSNTFLKTVSAFANYGDGDIIFGISDDGMIIGLNDLDKECLSIENKINDSIRPIPDYRLEIDEDHKIITLKVLKGSHKPYLYKSKAYKRADTSTVEIDRIELNRLILEGTNRSFEELPAYSNVLSFNYLEQKLIDKLGINELNDDILRTLDLYYDKNKYNRVAEILSDNNTFPGIDMVRFGDTIDEFLDREIFENMSVLQQFDKAVQLFKKYYYHEEIVGSERVPREIIPEKAFREALANAVVHRIWDVKASINVSMHEEFVGIVSPGGLPAGLSESEYIDGQISLLRNSILGNIFFRLRYMERFGTGIKRIKRSYEGAIIQPEFNIYPNSIEIKLPIINMRDNILSQDEKVIYNLLKNRKALNRKEVEEKTGFNKAKVIRILNQLIEKNSIGKTGQGRSTKYVKKE